MNFVEAGYAYWYASGQYTEGFSVYDDHIGGYSEYWSGHYVNPYTYPTVHIMSTGEADRRCRLLRRNALQDWASTGIAAARGWWGEERDLGTDNGNGSFRQVAYFISRRHLMAELA